MRPVNNSANQFWPDWKICSLVISQWNLCLAQVWTTIQILQIICNFATWCLNMGRQGCFHWSLKIFIAPIEELGKFTNSVTVIAWLLFLVAQNNFPLLVSCKTISLTRPPLPVTKCRGVGVVAISSKFLRPQLCFLCRRWGGRWHWPRWLNMSMILGWSRWRETLREVTFTAVGGKCFNSVQLFPKVDSLPWFWMSQLLFCLFCLHRLNHCHILVSVHCIYF